MPSRYTVVGSVPGPSEPGTSRLSRAEDFVDDGGERFGVGRLDVFRAPLAYSPRGVPSTRVDEFSNDIRSFGEVRVSRRHA